MSSSTQEKLNQVQSNMANAVGHAKEAAQNVTAKVTDFFQGNPFETPVGKKIELATDATKLATENWGLNMEICDFVNSTNDGGRDAIRAIRKRLQTQMGKNNAIVMYTLTVLETCVKNCDQRFKALVCQRDFVSELIKLIGAKYDAPQIVQERVLSLIQSWADAFRGNPALVSVCEVYEELKAKGVEFPATNLDSMAPIITPKRTVFPPNQPMQPGAAAANEGLPSNTPVAANTSYQFHRSPISASPEQLGKLRSELDVVNVNLSLLRELLGNLAPNHEDPEDYSLLQALHTTCKEMQKRVLELIPAITNEEVTYELLSMNDEFNSVFEKYNRYMTNRSGSHQPESSTTGKSTAADDLIDFNNPPEKDVDPVQQMASMSVSSGSHSNEAYIHDQAEVGLKTAAFNKTMPISEREAKEMADWLENTEKKSTPPKSPPSEGHKNNDDGL